jgi:acyl carrier protein
MELRTEPPRQRLIGMVRQILGSELAGALPVDHPLSDLGMNSLKMIDLMLGVESEFGIAIPQQDITPENFLSIATVEALVMKLAAAADS